MLPDSLTSRFGGFHITSTAPHPCQGHPRHRPLLSLLWAGSLLPPHRSCDHLWSQHYVLDLGCTSFLPGREEIFGGNAGF